MKKNLILPIVVLILISGFVYFRTSQTQITPPIEVTQQAVERKAVVEINFPSQEAKKFDIEDFTEGTTALAMTEAVVSVNKTGEGELAFVNTIDGIKAQEAKKEFWALYINDKQAEVGAGTYKVQNGDTISWKLENY